MMFKHGRHVFVAVGKRHPGLYSQQALWPASTRRCGALGVGNTSPGNHPVQLAGTDDLVGPGAVAVMKFAAIEVSNGAEANMRMRPHIDALSSQEFRRPDLIEEDERSHHLALRSGKARRTSKPPRSRERGMMRVSIASKPISSGQAGAIAGFQLMHVLLFSVQG